MSALEWLLWASVVWAAFFLYAAVDVPALVARWLRGHR